MDGNRGRGDRPLVVVAGIPGAGKSTALAALAASGAAAGLRVADSDSVRRRLTARLPAVPYPLLRPVVHGVHWLRIAVLALTVPGPLLVHETATRPRARTLLLAVARLSGRPARMVWLDVDVEAARRGQHDRRRVIRGAAFERHLARVRHRDPAAAAEASWDAVRRTERGRAPEVIAALAGVDLGVGAAARAAVGPRS